jgi:hypothetical protein
MILRIQHNIFNVIENQILFYNWHKIYDIGKLLCGSKKN